MLTIAEEIAHNQELIAGLEAMLIDVVFDWIFATKVEDQEKLAETMRGLEYAISELKAIIADRQQYITS